MKLKIRYENKYQTLEVETAEAEKWLNIYISEEESQENFEKRIQKKFEDDFNKAEYNNWHQFDRHRGYSCAKGVNEDGEEYDTSEPLMKEVVDDRIFRRDEINRQLQYDYEDLCQKIHAALKPEYADIVIAVHIKKISVQEYAQKIGIDANNASHRLKRAEKKLKKVF